jgi:hypothetical protein
MIPKYLSKPDAVGRLSSARSPQGIHKIELQRRLLTRQVAHFEACGGS